MRPLGADAVVLDDQIALGDVDAFFGDRSRHKDLQASASATEAIEHCLLLVIRLPIRHRRLIAA